MRNAIPAVRRIGALAVTALVSASCSGGSSSTTTANNSTTVADSSTTTIVEEAAVVVAADGAVALEFLASSLPEGIAPVDIEIRPVATSPDDPRYAALIAAGLELPTSYELSPDGLEFDTPMRLRLIGAGGMASAFHVSDDGFAALQPDVGATLENGEPAFLVPHFSTVSITLGDYHLWSVTPFEAQVGVAFIVPILAYRNPRGYPADHFDYTATVTASAPITPDHTAAPPLTRVATDTFTSFVTLSCAERGSSTVRLVAEIRAPWVAVEEMFWIDSISWQVECIDSSATAEARAAGSFSGEVGVAAITGFPGDDFSAPYELHLDPCGGAVLLQGSTQESGGIFRVTATDQDGEPLEVTILVIGAGEDYLEGYRLNGTFGSDGSISLDGVLAGGGHGFGAVPEGAAVLTLLDLLGEPEDQELGLALSDLEEFGWVGRAAGTLAPVGIGGDFPECAPVDLFQDLFGEY